VTRGKEVLHRTSRRVSRRFSVLAAIGVLLAAPLVAVNPAPSQAIVSAPAADVQLVKAMMATGRLTFAANPPEARLQFEAYAAGFVRAGIVVGGAQRYCPLDHVLLSALYQLIVAKGFSLRVTSFNRYCEQVNPPAYTSYHWVNGGGHALDVDKVNGQVVAAGSAQANAYINAMMSVMPAHDAGLGQLSCWTGIKLSPGWFTVPDNCNAVHIEYRGDDTTWVPTFVMDYDYGSDEQDDFLAIRNDGYLYLQNGSGAPSFTGQQIDTGWAEMYEVLHGDFNDDGNGDLLATDPAGLLWFYPGDGARGLGARVNVGKGWQTMSLMTGGADFTNDGRMDIIARKPDNTLWLYVGSGAGGFSSARQVGSGWGGMRTLVAGDFNGDNRGDIEAVDAAGNLWLYPGDGAGGWGARKSVGSGWLTIDLMTGGGDYNNDGKADIIARRATDMSLVLYPGNGSGGFGSPVQLDVAWTTYTKLI
jgi:hypothetical protein